MIHTSKRYLQPNQIVSPGIMTRARRSPCGPFGTAWTCLRHPLCPGNGALSRLASVRGAEASRLRAPFPGHNGCLMHVRVRIQKMVLLTGLPRHHPWGHMEVPLAALEEDFLWPPVWRCTASVTSPRGRGPQRHPQAGPGESISHPSQPVWQYAYYRSERH